ncbi:hypothetical protein [Buchnera aphidicola]|uniref:hypothetical protein n=1 Tax=Buchnera aphidicola TaxID=9 RepID=UPI0021C5BBC7|nr:hypothetical protein [Buchnera aphidicola]
MCKKLDTIMLIRESNIKDNSIEFAGRSFDFSDIKESEFYTRLFFKKNILREIKNIENNRNFSFFRLKPKLITILKSPEGKNVCLFFVIDIQKF